ncbi:gas vesicle protein [Halobacillus sp. BBL2006]|uniref:gas vesicle protein n=1 Tax=Halobacillus sp. BBL2006 TaxID=1543706 RepID=UPI0005423B8F|nr:gas vesicle protein [Halobacillus sp. BBL2006]KHE72832.1 gas vesicle protein GvpJ [Halobacillus sp. BBL2006]
MAIEQSTQSNSIVDVLETVLDKGVVIAGDIRVGLADVELLTIKIRLIVASVDKAKEIGMDWWENDPYLSSKAAEQDTKALEKENEELQKRIERLEKNMQSNRL